MTPLITEVRIDVVGTSALFIIVAYLYVGYRRWNTDDRLDVVIEESKLTRRALEEIKELIYIHIINK